MEYGLLFFAFGVGRIGGAGDSLGTSSLGGNLYRYGRLMTYLSSERGVSALGLERVATRLAAGIQGLDDRFGMQADPSIFPDDMMDLLGAMSSSSRDHMTRNEVFVTMVVRTEIGSIFRQYLGCG